MSDGKRLYDRIKRVVDETEIIDTHEHLLQEKERLSAKLDLFETILAHYASSDLVSSGMPVEDLEKIRNPSLPFRKRWQLLKPYWEMIQNTGYAKAVNIAVRDLYGLEGITDDTYEELASRMVEVNKPGVYEWILKQKSKIEVSILDSLFASLEDYEERFFAPVTRFGDFVVATNRTEIEALASRAGKPIHSFSDFNKALEATSERASDHIVGVKTGLAYMRELHFKKVSSKEAEEVFVNIYNQSFFRRRQLARRAERIPEGLSLRETKPLQDYTVHKIIQLAAEKRLPVQIHTGIQE